MNRRAREKAGRRAEWLAALYLRLKGYRVLEMRYKTPSGEIDIIARKKDILIFAEVKKRPTLEDAQDAIGWQSQKRIIRASEIYVSRTRAAQSLGMRYNAIYVLPGLKLIHEPDAWQDY